MLSIIWLLQLDMPVMFMPDVRFYRCSCIIFTESNEVIKVPENLSTLAVNFTMCMLKYLTSAKNRF